MTFIDYEKLKELNLIVSSANQQEENDNDRHKTIMANFDSIFLKLEKPLPGIPNKPTKAFQLSHAHVKRPKSRFIADRQKLEASDPPTKYDNPLSHDIRFYTMKKSVDFVRGQPMNDDLVFAKEKNIASLYSLIKKLPFQRTRKEHKQVYRLMRDLWPNELDSLLNDSQTQYPVLKELASVASLDTCNEAGLTVFGNTGLHLILRGSARPQTLPYLRSDHKLTENDSQDFPCPTPLLKRRLVHKLISGDWFGTLKKVEGREINSKVLTLITLEPCQFLKIPINDYQRILERIKQRIQNEKVNVVKAVSPYDKWAGMSIGKLAALMEWKTFSAGSVIMAEAEISPYIVFIRDGNCNVFRQVEALKTLPNGRKKRLFKNVLMGKLGAGDALGEYSILEQKPFSCTVVAVTDLDVGVIYPYKLEELDVTIRTLFSQSVQPKFADITEDDIHTNFIEQQMKDDWNQLKQKVLLQTINHCGIRPGYGKWSNPVLYSGQF